MKDTIYNLTALARYYQNKNSQAKFRTLIKEFSDAAEARQDLRFAQRMVDAFSLPREDYAETPVTFRNMGAAGIMGMSVIIYARATRPRNKSRGAVDIKPLLDPIYHEDHDRVQNLRDDAIAHLGPGKRDGDEAVFMGLVTLRVAGGMAHPSYYSSNKFLLLEEMDRLRRLLPVADHIVTQIANDRADKLFAEVRRLEATNLSFFDRLRATVLTDADMFEHSGGVQGLLSRPIGVSSDTDFQWEPTGLGHRSE